MTTIVQKRPGEAQCLYQPVICKVSAVSDLTAAEKLFRVQMPLDRCLGHEPGQFVQVSLPGFGEAPIAIASSPTRLGYFDLAVRKAGTLTCAMHGLKPGDALGIRGPFGTPFNLRQMRGNHLLLIAGGCGLAPMRSLIQYCEDCRAAFGDITLLYGARSPHEMLFKQELEAWQSSGCFRCQYTVDCLPAGPSHEEPAGQIAGLIPPLAIDVESTFAALIGPPAMYKFVIQELDRKGLPSHRIVVSLERHMKCGVGKCGHCTIEHLYCCLDGPVFTLDQIAALRGAL